MYKSIIFALLLCCPLFAQPTVTTEPFSAITAKAVYTEQMADKVVVILVDRDPGEKQGVWLKIASQSKWATPYHDSLEILSSSQPGTWMVFGKPGPYKVLIIEFDPEKGPRFTTVPITIGTTPDPAPVDPPPVGDFDSLVKIADEGADKVGDPKTRMALAKAYRVALLSSAGQPYARVREAVTLARISVMTRRDEESLAKDWNGWLMAIDSGIGKLVTAGNVAAYRQAIEAIVKGLEL